MDVVVFVLLVLLGLLAYGIVKKYTELKQVRSAYLKKYAQLISEKDAELAELRKRLAERKCDEMSDASTPSSYTIHISKVTREEVAALFNQIGCTDQCAAHPAPPYNPENYHHQKFW